MICVDLCCLRFESGDTSQWALEEFCIGDGHPDSFVLKLTEPWKIQHARDVLAGIIPEEIHIAGEVVQSHVDWNPLWDFYVIPESVIFFEAAMEVCDGSIQSVNWSGGPADGWWCPWSSVILFEIEEGVPYYCGPAR